MTDATPTKPFEPVDAETMGTTLEAIIQTGLDDHMRWTQGFLDWRTTQISQMAPMHPQAEFEFINRQQGMIRYMEAFKGPAAQLQAAGYSRLAAMLSHRIQGLGSLLGTFQSTGAKMAADNVQTANAVSAALSGMAAANLAAGQANMKLGADTFAQVSKMQADGMAAQRASFDGMVNRWKSAF